MDLPLLILWGSLLVAVLGVLTLGFILRYERRRRDRQRLFTWAQKQTLIAQAAGRCEHKLPLWRRCSAAGVEADHIIPWSRGGTTRLENGQLLCRRHNRRKSNYVPTTLYLWRLERRRRKY